MVALSNILPLVSLGSCCFLLVVLFGYHCWRRTSTQRADAGLENPDYEVEEIPGTTDFVMVGRRGHRKKKVKKPKLWDIWVPNIGKRPAHERKPSSGSSFSDLSLDEEVGLWNELKVCTTGPIISMGNYGLISACLAHICHLCQKRKQGQPTTDSHTSHVHVDGPAFRAPNHHGGWRRAHEGPIERVAIITLAPPFSR